MKRHWKVRRQFQPYPDGVQRWDRAYQYLPQWVRATELVVPPPPSSPLTQEVDHANSSLCPGVDPKSSREPNH